MEEMTALEQQMAVADQQMATGGVIFLAVLTFAIATALFRRRRFPHLLVWLLFLGWSTLVGVVPSLRELDQQQVGFYCLRGIPLGLLIASMANFAQLAPRRAAAEAAAE